VVLRTGFLTAKGSLVRSIMYPPPADFKFDQDSYKFIGILAAVAAIGFVYTLVLKVRPPEQTRARPAPSDTHTHTHTSHCHCFVTCTGTIHRTGVPSSRNQ
jgi:magnesium-transporting ATPase (P-type)